MVWYNLDNKSRFRCIVKTEFFQQIRFQKNVSISTLSAFPFTFDASLVILNIVFTLGEDALLLQNVTP